MRWTFCLVLLSCTCFTYGQSPGEKLSTLADEYQTWRLKENPATATTRGIYIYNDLLKSFSVSRYTGYKATVDAFHTRLMGIQLQDLNHRDRMTYKVLKNHLETFRDGYEWKNYKNLNPMNFLEGLLKNVERFPSRVPTDTIGDVENYLRRLKAWPQQISQIEESFRLSMVHNTTNHNVTMTRLMAPFHRLLNVANAKESDLYIPFKNTLEMDKLGYSSAERQSRISEAVTAVNAVWDKLRALRTFIETEYVTRPNISISSFTRGKDYYKAIMKWYLSLDLTPEYVHNKGVEEVARISNLMQQIMNKQGFSGSIKEYFDSLKNETRFFYETSEELLNGYTKQITEDIQPIMTKLFKDIPNLPVVVKPMSTDGPQGTYDRGTPDGKIPGTFWANALRPKDIAKYGMLALTMHETIPGHHLQIGIAMTSNMPAFRRSLVYDHHFDSPVGFPSFNSFSEGWALYAESLGEEVGLYKDDYELMGRYSSEIFRACRLVVDTGIHYFGWGREQAIDYVLNYTAFTRATVATEIDRYITWPGQALTYKIGELKIQELRKKAETKLGKNFDIREFHKAVLENGRIPLNVFEENMNDWLDSYVPVTTPTPNCPTSGSSGRMLVHLLQFLPLMIIRVL